jgi:hypothetical protein
MKLKVCIGELASAKFTKQAVGQDLAVIENWG